jgi:hypothetical protein
MPRADRRRAARRVHVVRLWLSGRGVLTASAVAVPTPRPACWVLVQFPPQAGIGCRATASYFKTRAAALAAAPPEGVWSVINATPKTKRQFDSDKYDQILREIRVEARLGKIRRQKRKEQGLI